MNEESITGKVITAEEFKAKARHWAQTVRKEARARAAAMSKGKTKSPYTYKTGMHAGRTEYKLKDKIGYRLRMKYGDIERVSFNFPLHGIFIEYGVGRGQPGEKSTKKASSHPKNYIRRKMSDWFDAPLDKNTEKLADIAAEYYGDKILLNIWGSKIKK